MHQVMLWRKNKNGKRTCKERMDQKKSWIAKNDREHIYSSYFLVSLSLPLVEHNLQPSNSKSCKRDLLLGMFQFSELEKKIYQQMRQQIIYIKRQEYGWELNTHARVRKYLNWYNVRKYLIGQIYRQVDMSNNYQ